MKVQIKEGEAFIKLRAVGGGRIQVTYGFDLGEFRKSFLQGEVSDESAKDVTALVSTIAGIVATVKDDLDIVMELGADAISEGFLDDDNNLYETVQHLDDDQLELLNMETEGNA